MECIIKNDERANQNPKKLLNNKKYPTKPTKILTKTKVLLRTNNGVSNFYAMFDFLHASEWWRITLQRN